MTFIVFAKVTSCSIPTQSQCSVFWDDHWLELDVLYKISIPSKTNRYLSWGQTPLNPGSALPNILKTSYFPSNISHCVYLLILSFSHFPPIVWSYFFRLIKVGQIVCSIQLPLQLLQFGLHQTISSLWTKKGDTTVAANFVQCLCNFDVLLPVTHPPCPCLFADWQFRPKQRSLPKQTGGNRKTETEDLKRIPPAAAAVDKLSLDLVSHQKTIFLRHNWIDPSVVRITCSRLVSLQLLSGFGFTTLLRKWNHQVCKLL